MKKENKSLIILIIIAIVICGVGLYAPFYIKSYIKIEGLQINDISGWIGDAITPFFTLASIILIIGTLILQRKDLQNQQEELLENRKDIQKQNETIELERFENSFFNLLKFHNETLNLIVIKKYEILLDSYSPYEIKGKEALKEIYEKFSEEYKKEKIDYDFFDSSSMKDFRLDVNAAVKKAYNKIYDDNIAQYFRSIYHLLKFIDRSSINYEEKKYFASLLRAQLSNYELIFIYYNCTSDLGKDKFKNLIQKYHILKNINKDLVLHESHLCVFTLLGN
ncbi:putative phage abortive infection protein [Clostridium perfringens]|uniref:putative phage abortive infection protein n=1 Tax=Clostridium perfringens TaxID=1502 RepID=UPI001CB51887|nr:putative phage abortive infection protein [Clostridium perfringens]HBI7022508.1 putative phage abortive infection protein [Clostridium perfringens]